MRITSQGIAVIENDNYVGRFVEAAGRLDYDQNTLPFILPVIRKGMTIVDAGANIGDHTIAYLNAVGSEGRVIAFECNPKAVECLRHNCPIAEIHSEALSDSPGVAFLEILDNPSMCRLSRCSCGNSRISTVGVKTVTLDSLNLQTVDFIKWDIQGSEVKALRGSTETLLRCQPIMVVELNVKELSYHGFTPADLLGILGSLNYTLKPIMPGYTFLSPKVDILCVPVK